MSETVLGSRRSWIVVAVVGAVAAGAWYSARGRGAGATVSVTDGRPKLLEFGMGLCEQCKRMKPVMAQAQRELALRLEVAELDIRNEANAELGRRLGLRVIPTVMLVDAAGSTTWRHEGFIAYAELIAEVDRRLDSTQPREARSP
jgi:thiol-disulfide isomerase/thioredoxin